MIAALIAIGVAAAALASAVLVLAVRLSSAAKQAVASSDARGRADTALAAMNADLNVSRAETEAARRDLAKQKEVTLALQSFAATRRPSAADAPGAVGVDLLLELAQADAAAAGGDAAVRAGDASSGGAGEDRLRSDRRAPTVPGNPAKASGLPR